MENSEILLKAILDGGKHSIIVTRPDGTVTFINHAAERLYGYAASDFVGKQISTLRGRIYEPSELEQEAVEMGQEVGRPVHVDDVFRVALDRRQTYERERTAIRRDGTRFQVLVTVTAMRDEDGRIVGYLSVSQDISERKRLERLKSEFIATVSHELRTPLTSIRGALGLMVGGAVGELPKAAAEIAEIAHRNSERLVRIINDILDMEKIESGKLDYVIRDFDLVALARQGIEENVAYAGRHGVRLVLRQSPESLDVTADPDRVLQVLANLLSNAAKFSHAGGEVHVDITATEAAAQVSVRDYGDGIPEDFRGRIFEKFAQSEASGAVRRQGTGLGLSISRKMVEGMGGAISFETETGKGTCFRFTVPLARQAGKTEAGAPSRPEPAAASPASGEARVLVCEDDRDVARLLALLLERAGFRVETVHDLAGARAALRNRDFAAMTLDVLLPDGDGLGFLNELRADPATRNLPVVVISGTLEHGRSPGAKAAVELVDWIPKPIDETTLVRALQWATRKNQRAIPRVLHVEDNDDLRRVLGDLFAGRAEWIGASTLNEAYELLKRVAFDLVVLDLGLPDGSGVELMERIASLAGNPVPVLILSASEPADAELRKRVAAILLKSRVSEEQVVRTVLDLVRQGSTA